MIRTYKQSKGFTLVEIMVATSIFMIIMLMAMGALLSTANAAKKAQALRIAMDNVNFAMESMTRSLRMGSDYTCVETSVILPAAANADCTTHDGGAIVFTPADPVSHPVGYVPPVRYVAYNRVERTDGTHTVQFSEQGKPSLDIVSPDVDVEDLKFFVKGSDLADGIQPSVYIIMKGSVLVKGEKTPFVIQTMTSQRNAE